ncbi:MAG TPA: replication factor C large subunit [Candidatus Nanoarchaeia archaeon]|nr:replication factor C large subunit [Candidatus Nanoarchaeia archaeon]
MTKEKSWVEKYRPSKYIEVRGQQLVIEKIKNFVEKSLSLKNSKNSMILYGPPGSGKTTLAHVSAYETNSEIFEINASDLRNKEKLIAVLKPAIEQRSLSQQTKIILVDEIDGISKLDWGGLSELESLIELSQIPIILTANDIWDKKFSPIRQKSELVQLKEIDYKTIKDVLINILYKEKLKIDPETLTKISIKAKGDLRAAINDLQALSTIQDPSSFLLDERNKEIDIFNALRLIFKGKPTQETAQLFDSVNMPLDEIILWVEENIPLEYQGEELAKAIDILSKVDIFKGRIYKQQYWRFLVYENLLLSYGISSAKRNIKTGFTSYKKPERILKIWLHNQRTAKKKSIAQKYASHVHVGEKRALNEFPFIKTIINSNPKIQKELRLTEEEIEYLEK